MGVDSDPMRVLEHGEGSCAPRAPRLEEQIGNPFLLCRYIGKAPKANSRGNLL